MSEDPARLSGTLSALARTWGMESPVETARIFSSWQDIVGPEVAARCRPTSLRAGVLKVQTDSAVWASEFRYLSGDVIRRINGFLGHEVVRQVKPSVKPSVGENSAMPNRSAPPRTATSRGTAQMAREAAEVARSVADPKVSEALRRAVLASKISQGGTSKVVYSKGSEGADKSPSHPSSYPSRRHR
ncbi:MAG TPA: DUF721 domain-containing protein [Actinomycetota bacterium]|nr:DUF721 domain-containing protein [Actinomycetota bacterium]